MHARGAGACGTFTVTADVTKCTRAGFLSEMGKGTKVFPRFPTVAGGPGAPDAVRDPRGFALKFSTEEGDCDLVGNDSRRADEDFGKRLEAAVQALRG